MSSLARTSRPGSRRSALPASARAIVVVSVTGTVTEADVARLLYIESMLAKKIARYGCASPDVSFSRKQTEFMQKRLPVVCFGPSSNTWPRCEPHLA